MNPYFGLKGIEQLSEELSGKENIYLGIRPYGFHAGNEVVFVIYPLLLCEALKKKNKTPEFNFFFFINDWEQDRLDGPHVKDNPYNIYPLKTTFQYMPDPNNCCENIVDHWESIIKENVLKIKDKFPMVNVKLVRNSSLKNHPCLKYVLFKTIRDKKIIINVLKKNTNKKVLDEPSVYAMAVCPICKMVKGITKVIDSKKNIVYHKCYMCGHEHQDRYNFFDYWLYHKVLALPRIEIFNIDLCITGLDHYNEGDFLVRKQMMDSFNICTPMPKMLFSPLVLGEDGKQMGKSRGNDVYVEVKQLLNIVKNNRQNKIMISKTPKKTIGFKKDNKKTAVFFSNPFGYGPTGILIALLENFCKHWTGDVVCVASGLTKEPHNKNYSDRVKFIDINQRDIFEIKKLLRKIKNPHIVSSLNRFAVQAAFDLKMPSVFIDSLTWFWNDIPEQYFLAGKYYCPDIPNTYPKLSYIDRCKVVPAILGRLPKQSREKKDEILIHIGGAYNPLDNKLPKAYLKILAECVNNSDIDNKIFIAGGKDATEFLEKNITKDNVSAKSLSRDEFLHKLSLCKHFLTTAGLTSTLESFALNIPISFLLPMNLSQWALVNVLESKKIYSPKMQWEDYIDDISDLDKLKEKEAVQLFSLFAEQILTSKKKKSKVVKDFNNMINKSPDTKNQLKFINKIGINGAQVIVKDIIKCWS